jgi:hypothetical protein
MDRLVAFCFLLYGAVSLGTKCSTFQPRDQFQEGDTVVTVFGRRVLVPMGAEEPYMNISINDPDVAEKWLRPLRRTAPLAGRQVTFSKIKFWGVVGGKKTAETYYQEFSNWAGDERHSVVDFDRAKNGKFFIICDGCPRGEEEITGYLLYWFTPNEEYAFQVTYYVEINAYEKLGGISELRRFAQRVRLLD